MDVMWNDALQGVAPITGGQPLPPGTYRLRLIGGEGKINSSQAPMMSLQFEVASGPLAGRKAFHNENLPKGSSDQDKQRMGYFLGLMEAFGVTGAQLGQMFAGQPINEHTIEYLAKALVQQGRTIKGTCRPQKSDETRINWGSWAPDDGIEPEPPKALSNPAPAHVGPPSAPNGFAGGPPAGLPQGGFPPQGPTNVQAPAAQGGLPLGGFPGSGGMQPTQEPAWATQQPVQGQAPQQFGGPGQAAPAAQPQAAGLNQFGQAAAAQFPFQQQAATPSPTPMQEPFPGQQFPGQVNPAAFPPAGQAPGQQMPGMPQAQQQAPSGLPQGGFPGPSAQPPTANI